MNVKAETKALADELAAGTSVRRITLASGAVIEHEVGGVSWVDVLHYERMALTLEPSTN